MERGMLETVTRPQQAGLKQGELRTQSHANLRGWPCLRKSVLGWEPYSFSLSSNAKDPYLAYTLHPWIHLQVMSWKNTRLALSSEASPGLWTAQLYPLDFGSVLSRCPVELRGPCQLHTPGYLTDCLRYNVLQKEQRPIWPMFSWQGNKAHL